MLGSLEGKYVKWQDVLKLYLYRKGTSFRLSVINRLGQKSKKAYYCCRQTRGKVGKHNFLDEKYTLQMKKLFTRPDF